MRTALASILASPFWAINASAYRATLPTLVKRLVEHQAAAPAIDAAGWNDLFPQYFGPDGATMKALEGELQEQNITGAIAVVNLKGTIVKECMAWEEVWFGLCSSDRVSSVLGKLANDPRISAIVINGYTPGGQVNGTEALGRAIQSAAAKKPVVGFADCMVASAGYWAFSNCTHIMLSGRSAEVGSIGVMFSMLDDIPFYESIGFKYYEEYDTEAKEKNAEIRKLVKGDNSAMQAYLDEVKAVFKADVRAGRGGKVNKHDEVYTGAMYMGQASIDAGLSDSIGDLAHAINYARALAPKSNATHGSTATTNNTTTMKSWKEIATAVKGLFTGKTTLTGDDLKEGNEALKAEGVTSAVLVTAEQAAELAGLTDLKAKAGKVDGLETEVKDLKATATKNSDAIAAALKECGLKVEEGKDALTIALDALKAKPGATHAGGSRSADPKNANEEEMPTVKAAREAGVTK